MIKKVEGGVTTQQVNTPAVQVERAPMDLAKTLSKDEIAEITKLLQANQASNQARGIAGQPPIVARYMVVPPIIVPPDNSLFPNIGEALQTLINKVTTQKPGEKEPKVSVAEARLVRKMFNFAVADAKQHGKDIGTEVVNFLQQSLATVRMSDKAQGLIFGKGGPGENSPIYYILPPPTDGGGTQPPIYYILPPNMEKDPNFQAMAKEILAKGLDAGPIAKQNRGNFANFATESAKGLDLNAFSTKPKS